MIVPTFALGLLLVNLVSVTPVTGDSVEKRDQEAVYLVNCNLGYSIMDYYSDNSQSFDGVVPSDNNDCEVDISNYVTWEGQAISCTFGSGVTFTSHINSGAENLATGAYAGWGYNGHNWDCYKDDGRALYTTGEATCNSIYYCFDA